MDNWIKLIEAIAKLVGSFAWPLAAGIIVIYLLKRHRTAVDGVFTRMTSVSLPGGIELGMQDQVEGQEQRVVEAAERVATTPPEERAPAIEELITEAERNRRFQELIAKLSNRRAPRSEREQALDELWQLKLEPVMGGEPIRTVDAWDAEYAREAAMLRRWVRAAEHRMQHPDS